MRLSSFILVFVFSLCSFQVQANFDCQGSRPKVSQFFQLVEEGDQTEIGMFLKGNVVAYDARNEFCETAFHVAIRNNDMELFDYLYGKFNEPDISASFKGKNIKSVEGKNNLRNILKNASWLYNYALIYGTSNTIRHVKELGGSFHWSSYSTDFSLSSRKEVKAFLLAHNQSPQGRILLFRYIKEADVDINNRPDDDSDATSSVFMSAAPTVSKRRLNFMIETLDGDVNQMNVDGVTPLFVVSVYSYLKTARENAKLLLNKGAKHTKAEDDETPLMYFAQAGAVEVIKELAQRGEDMNYRPSKDVHSPVVWAIEGKEPEAVKTLVKWGASINHIEEFDSDLDPRRKRPYDYAKSDEMRDLLSRLGAVSNAHEF